MFTQSRVKFPARFTDLFQFTIVVQELVYDTIGIVLSHFIFGME